MVSKALPAGIEDLPSGSEALPAGNAALPPTSKRERMEPDGTPCGHRPLRGRCPLTNGGKKKKIQMFVCTQNLNEWS